MNDKKNILIVEDEKTLQKVLGDILTQNGYNVSSAFDGASGLEKALNGNLDLVLLDVVLPKMNGFEVLKELKRNDFNAPVVILTNLSNTNDVQKAFDLGASTYLVKADFHLDDILKKIKDILDANDE